MASTFFTLRARPGSATTRTTEVFFSALARVLAAAARGKGPGVVHRAISTSRVRRLPRTPTRNRPRSLPPER